MDLATLEILVESSIGGDPKMRVQSNVSDEGDLRLGFTAEDVEVPGRSEVRWKVYAGREVFSFWFGDFWAVDFDYDIDPLDKVELVRTWVGVTEAYLRGEGTIANKKTIFRRIAYQELTLWVSGDLFVLTSQPSLFGRR